MEAPDKIFRVEGWLTNEPPQKTTSYIEYIRKDALLKWAKSWQNELGKSLGESMVHYVLNEVITKIKSL